LLTPLSLPYHPHHQSHTLSSKSHISQHLIPTAQQQQQQMYATTHRTFPSAEQADLHYSLKRKSLRNGSSNGPMADIMDIGHSNGGRGIYSSTSGSRAGLWHADLIQGHHHNNGGVLTNGRPKDYGGNSYQATAKNGGPNGFPNGNGVGSNRILGRTDGNHYSSSNNIPIPLINPGAVYQSMRNNEINV